MMFYKKHVPPPPLSDLKKASGTAEFHRHAAAYWEKVAALAVKEGDNSSARKSFENAEWNRQQAREQEVVAEMGIKR